MCSCLENILMHSIQGAFLIKDISYELYFIFICPLVRIVRSPLSGARNLLLRPLVIRLRLTRRPRLFTSKGIIGGSFFCTLLLITQPTLLKCRHMMIKIVLVDIIICIHEVCLTKVKSLIFKVHIIK